MTAFFTALNDDFMPGMRALLNSLLVNNPWFNLDYLILTDGSLSDKSISELHKIYSKIKIINVKKDDYLQCRETTEKWNYNLYYRFDVFELGNLNYNKIIMIDSDMLILKDISELLSYNCSFGVCRKYPDIFPELNSFENNFFNCGLMLLSGKNIIKLHKDNLITFARQRNWSSDQPLFNLYFRNTTSFLPEKYNTVSSAVTKENLSDISILHFHGNNKPWLHTDTKKCFSQFVPKLLAKAGQDADEILMQLKALYEKYR
jgi:lipopolysaccharide biosynthesis glycosyltransferase